MRGKEMESKKILLLFMFFFHLCVLPLSSSAIHQQRLPSDFVQDEDSRGEITHEQGSNSVDGDNTGKSAMNHSNKLEHKIGYGAARSGARPNPGEAGSNGGTKTPSTQGGTTFIPIYAAGAANNHHPYHRGAANCNRIGASTLIAATMSSVLHLYYVLFRWG